MFCFQCQETAGNKGCTKVGVCGKNEATANLEDLLVYLTKGLAQVIDLSENPESKAYELVCDNLFMTITNANFDEEAIMERIIKTIDFKEKLLNGLENKEGLSENALYKEKDREKLKQKALEVGVLNILDEDKRSLTELITYGLKGACAYNHHANVLGFHDESLDKDLVGLLKDTINDDFSIDDLIKKTMETGNVGYRAMALLDKANIEKFGNPEISRVDLTAGKRPGILVSGHDLKDLAELLEQAEDSGVDIYTHSEMLPANYYPYFKKYENFHGNYGNSRRKQNEEFEKFHGPILMTTNCIVPMNKDNTYKDKLFTTGDAGYPGCVHIEADEKGHKDFSQIIEKAKTCKAPENLEDGKLVGGFAHKQVEDLAPKIVEEVKAGHIKKFVVMAGCDGRFKSRSYYTDFAKALPEDYVILTAGCAKYRYNKLDLGDINGIPRVLDAGQCNDSYSLIQTALLLKEAFNLSDVNDLPLAFNIARYEQKAVIVLLALLSLGIKNIHLGPTLPAFLSPTVVDFLVENFGISPQKSVEEDIEYFTK